MEHQYTPSLILPSPPHFKIESFQLYLQAIIRKQNWTPYVFMYIILCITVIYIFLSFFSDFSLYSLRNVFRYYCCLCFFKISF